MPVQTLLTLDAKELREAVKPNLLRTVLASLKRNGLIITYKYNKDTVTVAVPKGVEVGIFLKGLKNDHDT